MAVPIRGGFFDDSSSDDEDQQKNESSSENVTVKAEADADEEEFHDAYQEIQDDDAEEEDIEIVADDEDGSNEVDVPETAIVDEEEDEEGASDINEASNIEVQSFVEEGVQEGDEEAASFTTETVIMDDPSIDDGDSSAFVDRMELADAYDEGETTPGSFELESSEESAAPAGDLPAKVIDAATRKTLIKDLKYRPGEVDVMKPDIAALVVEKRLDRPQEGIPKNFIRTDLPKRRNLMKVLPKVLAGGVVVAAAVVANGKLEFLQQTRQESSESLLLDEVMSSLEAAASTEKADEYDSVSSESEVVEDDIKHVNEHTDSIGDLHPHSLKPGQPPNDQLDVTWLDKAITFVENKIKAALRMEM